MTDGINTDGPSLADAAQYARRRGVPLFFIALGSDQPVRDLKLSDLIVDDVVFVNDVVPFECKLTTVGLEGKKLSIVLREKGKPAVLASVQTAAGSEGRSQRVGCRTAPLRSANSNMLSRSSRRRASRQRTTAASRVVQVRRDKIRVLLVQAYPSFEFRYLRNMLQRDETISLRTVLQDADLEHAEQDASASGRSRSATMNCSPTMSSSWATPNPALLRTRRRARPGRFRRSAGQGGRAGS